MYKYIIDLYIANMLINDCSMSRLSCTLAPSLSIQNILVCCSHTATSLCCMRGVMHIPNAVIVLPFPPVERAAVRYIRRYQYNCSLPFTISLICIDRKWQKPAAGQRLSKKGKVGHTHARYTREHCANIRYRKSLQQLCGLLQHSRVI